MRDDELYGISKPEKKLFARLKWFFIAFWVAMSLLLFMPSNTNAVSGIALIALVTSKLVFLYYIGCLAVEAKKSRVLWILGSLIAPPFGMVIAFVRMRNISIENHWI
jgi:hypothetical protein